jgi:hypothetical protein
VKVKHNPIAGRRDSRQPFGRDTTGVSGRAVVGLRIGKDVFYCLPEHAWAGRGVDRPEVRSDPCQQGF